MDKDATQLQALRATTSRTYDGRRLKLQRVDIEYGLAGDKRVGAMEYTRADL